MMQEITLDATVENIDKVTAFIDQELEQIDCPMKAQMQIDVAIDELFGNIAHYAYKDKIGQATVQFNANENKSEVSITFIDNGVPYNPLAKEDPDTTLSAQERDIGGLGIFIVKKTMDDIIYNYSNNQNVLTIKKLLK